MLTSVNKQFIKVNFTKLRMLTSANKRSIDALVHANMPSISELHILMQANFIDELVHAFFLVIHTSVISTKGLFMVFDWIDSSGFDLLLIGAMGYRRHGRVAEMDKLLRMCWTKKVFLLVVYRAPLTCPRRPR